VQLRNLWKKPESRCLEGKWIRCRGINGDDDGNFISVGNLRITEFQAAILVKVKTPTAQNANRDATGSTKCIA